MPPRNPRGALSSSRLSPLVVLLFLVVVSTPTALVLGCDAPLSLPTISCNVCYSLPTTDAVPVPTEDVCVTDCAGTSVWNPSGSGAIVQEIASLSIGGCSDFQQSTTLVGADMISIAEGGSLWVGKRGVLSFQDDSELRFLGAEAIPVLVEDGGSIVASEAGGGCELGNPGPTGTIASVVVRSSTDDVSFIQVDNGMDLRSMDMVFETGSEIRWSRKPVSAGSISGVEFCRIYLTGGSKAFVNSTNIEIVEGLYPGEPWMIVRGGSVQSAEFHMFGSAAEEAQIEHLFDDALDVNWLSVQPGGSFICSAQPGSEGNEQAGCEIIDMSTSATRRKLLRSEGGRIEVNAKLRMTKAVMDVGGGRLVLNNRGIVEFIDMPTETIDEDNAFEIVWLRLAADAQLCGVDGILPGQFSPFFPVFNTSMLVAGDPGKDISGSLTVQSSVLFYEEAGIGVFIDSQGESGQVIFNDGLAHLLEVAIPIHVILSDDYRAWPWSTVSLGNIIEISDTDIAIPTFRLAPSNETERLTCAMSVGSGGRSVALECDYNHPMFDALGEGLTVTLAVVGVFSLTAGATYLIRDRYTDAANRPKKVEGGTLTSDEGGLLRKGSHRESPERKMSGARKGSGGPSGSSNGGGGGKTRKASGATLEAIAKRNLERVLRTPEFVLAFANTTPVASRAGLMRSLVTYFASRKKESDLLGILISAHVAKAKEPGDLFRSSSATSAAVLAYMSLSAPGFLQLMLGPPVSEIVDSSVLLKHANRKTIARASKKSGGTSGSGLSGSYESVVRELDPASAQADDVNEAKDILVHAAEGLTDCITDAQVPAPIHQVMNTVHRIVTSKFPQSVADSVIATLYLSRYVTPAVSLPAQYGIVSSPPGPKTSRNLLLVAKMVSGLASQVQFGLKEQFLAAVEDFRKAFTPDMTSFLAKLGQAEPAEAVEPIIMRPETGLAALDELYEATMDQKPYIHAELGKSSPQDVMDKWKNVLEPREGSQGSGGTKRKKSTGARTRKRSASAGSDGAGGPGGSPTRSGSPNKATSNIKVAGDSPPGSGRKVQVARDSPTRKQQRVAGDSPPGGGSGRKRSGNGKGARKPRRASSGSRARTGSMGSGGKRRRSSAARKHSRG